MASVHPSCKLPGSEREVLHSGAPRWSVFVANARSAMALRSTRRSEISAGPMLLGIAGL